MAKDEYVPVPNQMDVVGMAKRYALQDAIVADGISIVSNSGLSGIQEYNIDSVKNCWYFEPNPSFTRSLDHHVGYDPFKKMDGAAGKEKLFNMLGASLAEINSMFNYPYDIEVLTPSQAAAVVENLIRRKMKYEELLNPEADEIKRSSNTDLIGIRTSDPEKFKNEVAWLEESLDNMTASELLDKGWGVCRHIAGIASVLYEVLKEKQKGILLNGTYLTYHDEINEIIEGQASVGSHAYNMLVITYPRTDNSKSGGVDASLTILDMTFGIDNNNTDYTWSRISQACSFLTRYGRQLEISDIDSKVQMLLEKAVIKCENDIQKMGFDKWVYSGCSADYVSLLNQVKNMSGFALDHLLTIFEKHGKDRVDMLLGNKVVFKGERTEDLLNQLFKVEYTAEFSDKFKSLLDLMANEVCLSAKYFEYHRNDAGADELPDRNTMLFVGEFVRASVALSVIPNEKNKLIIKHVLDIQKKKKLDVISRELITDYEKLISD